MVFGMIIALNYPSFPSIGTFETSLFLEWLFSYFQVWNLLTSNLNCALFHHYFGKIFSKDSHCLIFIVAFDFLPSFMKLSQYFVFQYFHLILDSWQNFLKISYSRKFPIQKFLHLYRCFIHTLVKVTLLFKCFEKISLFGYFFLTKWVHKPFYLS